MPDFLEEKTLWDLERLGYWQEAEDAEAAWAEHKPWHPDGLSLPLSIRQAVDLVNTLL